jgi:hypothetical protein
MNTVLYLCYGDDPHTAEVRCSIASAWRFGCPAADGLRLAVYTDRPAAFEDFPVAVTKVRAAEWAEWSGSHAYRHRRKIPALRRALAESGGPVVIVDGDTWWRRPPRRLFARIAPGRAVMHIREGRLDRVADPLYRRTLEIIAQTAAPAGEGPLPPTGHMWNAGVVGLHPADSNRLGEVLAWTDTMCAASTGVHVLEQLAFSHVLACRMRLAEAGDVVVHYWPAAWRAAIRDHIRRVEADGGRGPGEVAERFFDGLPRGWPATATVRSFLSRVGLRRTSIRRNEW